MWEMMERDCQRLLGSKHLKPLIGSGPCRLLHQAKREVGIKVEKLFCALVSPPGFPQLRGYDAFLSRAG